jgi:hypothetical protein
MRNRLRAQGIEAPRGACRGGSKGEARKGEWRIRSVATEAQRAQRQSGTPIWENPVATVATGTEKRGWKLLIPKGRLVGVPPPRVFCEKRLDLLDYKGVDFFEAAQEAASGRKQRR